MVAARQTLPKCQTMLGEKGQTQLFFCTKILCQAMDEREQDRSAKSRQDHVRYYRSLSKTIASTQKEMDAELEDAIQNHLRKRVDAMLKDKKRIEEMFPDIDWNKIDDPG